MSQSTHTPTPPSARPDGEELHGLALVALLESRLAVSGQDPAPTQA